MGTTLLVIYWIISLKIVIIAFIFDPYTRKGIATGDDRYTIIATIVILLAPIVAPLILVGILLFLLVNLLIATFQKIDKAFDMYEKIKEG
jgi:hypothetical protein